MTVEQYRALSDLEKDQTLMYLKGFEFEVPNVDASVFTRHMLSIDWYYNQRFKERENFLLIFFLNNFVYAVT